MRFIFLFSILLLSKITFSQVGIQFSMYKPTGLRGYIYKPGIITEIQYGGYLIEDKLFFSASFGYGRISPQRDTLNIAVYHSENILYEGYEVISKMNLYIFGINSQYRFLEPSSRKSTKGIWGGSPTIGLDVNVIVSEFNDIYQTPFTSGSTTNEQLSFIGITPKMGGVFNIGESINLYFGLGKTVSKSPDGIFNFWKPYTNLFYNF